MHNAHNLYYIIKIYYINKNKEITPVVTTGDEHGARFFYLEKGECSVSWPLVAFSSFLVGVPHSSHTKADYSHHHKDDTDNKHYQRRMRVSIRPYGRGYDE